MLTGTLNALSVLTGNLNGMITIGGVVVNDVEIVDGNLIFTLADGTEVNAGNVIGPQGEQGNPSTVNSISAVAGNISIDLDDIPETDASKKMTPDERTKLAGIETGANLYTHPSSHSPSIITQDSSNRFVTDAEKSTWNGKLATNGSANDLTFTDTNSHFTADEVGEGLVQLGAEVLSNTKDINAGTNIFNISTAVFTPIGGYEANRTLTKTSTGIECVCTSTEVSAALRYETSLTVPSTGRYLISSVATATSPHDAIMRVYVNTVSQDLIYGVGELAYFINLTLGDTLKLGFYDHVNTPVASTTTYSDIKVRLCGSLTNSYNSKLRDKKVVCFGDSTLGMFAEPSDYASVIYDLTGAEVVNVGFSGCEMSDHSSSTYKPFSMNRLADSMTTGDWALQDAQIGSLPTFASKLTLLKNMVWEDVDYITIGYGTNDWASNKYIYDESGGDRTNSAGKALEYSIETIQTKYPHLKILVVDPLWRNISTTLDSDVDANSNGDYLYEYANKFDEIAKSFKIPSLNLYYNSGINKYTNLLYLQDGTHPNAEGRRIIGNLISQSLLGNVYDSYVHPVTHPPSIIAETTSDKFVSDTQINSWDALIPLARPNKSRAVVIETDFYIAVTGYWDTGLYGTLNGSGTIDVSTSSANHPGVITIKDSTTANGGARIRTDNSQFLIAGGETAELIFMPKTARTTASFIFGFLDCSSIEVTPTDGVWINVVGDNTGMTISGKTNNNTTPSTTGTSYSMTLGTWYSAKIVLNVDATLATFTLYAENGTQLWQDTISTTIPTGAARYTGFGIVAGETTTDAAAEIVRLDYMSMAINKNLVR